jgi:hypothetical protein
MGVPLREYSLCIQMCVCTEDSKRMKQKIKTKSILLMRKLVEKVVLAFCYVVIVGSCINGYAYMISDTEKLTPLVVFNLIVIGLGLVFLSVMAFILLFTKRTND